MAMKPITSFFNSPPQKTSKNNSPGGKDLHSFFSKKNDENCNGLVNDVILNGKGEDGAHSKANGLQQNDTKDKRKLSRKRLSTKDKSNIDKSNVEPSHAAAVKVTEPESSSDSKSRSVRVKDMSSVEMSYEDFLTAHDPEDVEQQPKDEVTVIEDSPVWSSNDASEKEVRRMESEDSQGSQDVFSESIVAGYPLFKDAVPLDAEKSQSETSGADSSKTTVKQKRNSKLSRKAKSEAKPESGAKEDEKSETIKEKSAKTAANKRKSSGSKQMTLFGKVIDSVPKLETETDIENDAKQEEEGEDTLESLPVVSAPKSKNIMNFFSKVDKKFPSGKKPDSEKVTCLAEVHSLIKDEKGLVCSPTPEMKQKVSPRRRSNVAVEEMDMSITELGFTMITVLEKKKRTRRHLVEQGTKALDSVGAAGTSSNASEQNKSEENDQHPEEVIDNELNDYQKDGCDIRQQSSDDDEVIIGATEETQESQEAKKLLLASQMAILDTVKVPVSKRTTQATLNFSGKGCVIQKAQVPKESKTKETSNEDEAKSEDSDLEILADNRRGKRNGAKGNKKGKKAGRRKQSIGNSITPPKSSKNGTSPLRSPFKTPSKRIYSSRILPAKRNSLPGLRMKFTSIRNSSGNDRNSGADMEEIAKLTAKMSKAQQILDKAKKASHSKMKTKLKKVITPVNKTDTKTAKKVVEDELISPTLRRSSRQSSLVAKTAISECLSPADFMSPKGKQKKDRSPVNTPNAKTPKSSKARKQEKNAGSKTPSRTPSKKKVKLAAIFKGKGSQQDDSDDDVKVTKVQLDPELVRVRREFLLSGVPEKLKKQAEAEASCAGSIDDYPPLPEVSHVQQCPPKEDRLGAMFNLKHVSLSCLKSKEPWTMLDDPPAEILCKDSLTCSKDVVKQDVKLSGVEDKGFDEETLKYLLAEVSSRNPTFPVRRVYKQLVKKYEQTKGTWVEPTNTAEKDVPKEKNSKKRKLLLGDADEPPRRSKRRRAASDADIKSDNDDCCVIEDTPKPENSDKSRELLWTDKYSPSSSTEVLVNTIYSKRLKTWLQEWRQRTDLEVKKIKKQLMKEAKKDSKIKEEIQKSLGESWWTDDESDFEVDTEDDSDYDDDDLCDGLSNTMVLTGPHGVGKTAMVYAVAQELGYKIFEVNASSKRAGKQMLAELQEATQSHQVAQHNMDKLFTTFKMIQTERRKSLEVTKPEKKMNNMFASFFTNSSKPSAPPKPKGKQKTPEKPAKAKKAGTPGKVKSNTELGRMTPKKGLNLNSTSLILFEEVDVIFEEDKGFWTAIETFMNTTKRPIILTASDSKVAAAVSRRPEVLKIKPSPPVNLTSYLQLMCLAEKLRTDHDDVTRLIKMCGGDLRRAILTLQYWILSGAGSVKLSNPVKYNPEFFNKKQDNSATRPAAAFLMKQPISTVDSGKDSEEEFEITSFSKKRRRPARMVLESGDESSNASPVKPLKFTCLQTIHSDSVAEESQDELINVVGVTEKELRVAPVFAPALHDLFWHSASGPALPNITSSGGLLQVLQDPATSLQAWELVSWYLSSKFNLVYANLMQLIDLPKVQLIPPRLPSFVNKESDVTKRRRIRINNDIFDCEDSDNEAEKDDVEAKMEVAQSKSAIPPDNQEKAVPTVDDAVAACGVKALAELFDNLSYSDAHFCTLETAKEGSCGRNEPFSWCSGQIRPGLTDGQRSHGDNCSDATACDLRAGVHLYSVHKTNRRLQVLKRKVDSLETNCRKKASKSLCLPVPSETCGSAKLQLSSECPSLIRLQGCRKQAVEHVSSCLPLCVHCNHRAFTMDVMPYIRNMCQSEQVRQATNTKRRFTHYLDSISFGVTRKQNVLDVLCTSFT